MRTLAVIAHDHKKACDTLGRFRLIATRHTARLMMASLADERVRPAAGWASPD